MASQKWRRKKSPETASIMNWMRLRLVSGENGRIKQKIYSAHKLLNLQCCIRGGIPSKILSKYLLPRLDTFIDVHHHQLF